MSQSERAFQQDRVQALTLVRTTLEQERRTFVWLAKRLSIPKSRLMSYVYGYARIPLDVLERACLILNINTSDILSHLERNHLDRSTLLQDAPNGRNRPRATTTKALDKTGDKNRKAVSHDSSDTAHPSSPSTRSRTSSSPKRRTRTAGGNTDSDSTAVHAALGRGSAG